MTSDCIPHQVLVLRQFFEAMADKPDRVTYGLRPVRSVKFLPRDRYHLIFSCLKDEIDFGLAKVS